MMRFSFLAPLTAGTGVGQVRLVQDNSSNQVTISPPWAAIPDASSQYVIRNVLILGRVTTRTEYDRDSRATYTVQDDGDTSHTQYDGLSRVIETTDPEGNTVETAYDADSNAIETKQTDVTTVPNVAPEAFVTTSFYDSLNRLQTQVDNLGQATYSAYDARGNLVAQADANGPTTGPNAKSFNRRGLGTGSVAANGYGFVTLTSYDGLSRPVESDTLLPANNTVDGSFLGADAYGIRQAIPTGYLDTSQAGDGLISSYSAYDADSQLLASRDDNGSTTAYVYDDQGRTRQELKGQSTGYQQTTFTIPGGDSGSFNVSLRGGVPVSAQPTSLTVGYDRDGNPTGKVDESGNQLTTTFDALDRPIGTQIILAAGFYGTTQQARQYDGLSRPTQEGTDNQGVNTGTVTTKRFYDSLSRPVEEQNQIGNLNNLSKAVSWNYDSAASGSADSPSAELYPAVSDNAQKRQIDNQFDSLGRLISRRDHRFTTGAPYAPLGTVQYIGPGRAATRTYQNSVRLTYIGRQNSQNADVGYDGLGRPIKQVWEQFTPPQALGNGTLRVGFGYVNSTGPAYDRSGNLLLAEKLHNPGNSEVYAYRAGMELSGFQRGTLNATKTAIATPTPTPGARQNQSWTLDGLGNWGQTTYTNQGGGATTESRRHTTLNAIQNVAITNGTPVPYTEDANGNLLDDGTRTFRYDALNRLHQVYRKADGMLIAEYLYDADGRRVETVVSNNGLDGHTANGTTTLWYSGWDVIEEEDGSGNDLQQYVYGDSPNELWALDNRRNGTAVDQLNAAAGEYRDFYLTDPEGSVYGLTNQGGALQEAYQYDPYGVQTVFDPTNPSGGVVDFTNPSSYTVTVGGYSQLLNQAVNPFLFTGQRVDRETGGLYDYNNRIYSPVLGRFLQEDPLGSAVDSNFYRYVHNAPTAATDPSGLEEQPSWWQRKLGALTAGLGDLAGALNPLGAVPMADPSALAGLARASAEGQLGERLAGNAGQLGLMALEGARAFAIAGPTPAMQVAGQMGTQSAWERIDRQVDEELRGLPTLLFSYGVYRYARGPAGALTEAEGSAAGNGSRGLAPGTTARSGRYTFDFEAMRFRDAQGDFVPFEQVQQRTFASMERARARLNFPEGENTLARLDADGRSLLGRNSGAVEGGTDVTLRPLNAQTRTHAEGEVFQRFFDKGMSANEGVLWVDRGFCGSCGTRGGVGSLLLATRMERVIAVTPDGVFLINASRPSTPIPITIR